jgi:APA family basic amino acid/polyamine antiporter
VNHRQCGRRALETFWLRAPLGILGALLISTVLYVGMSRAMTGMVSYTTLDVDEPVAVALDAHPQLSWLKILVKTGINVGMTSVILTSDR